MLCAPQAQRESPIDQVGIDQVSTNSPFHELLLGRKEGGLVFGGGAGIGEVLGGADRTQAELTRGSMGPGMAVRGGVRRAWAEAAVLVQPMVVGAWPGPRTRAARSASPPWMSCRPTAVAVRDAQRRDRGVASAARSTSAASPSDHVAPCPAHHARPTTRRRCMLSCAARAGRVSCSCRERGQCD